MTVESKAKLAALLIAAAAAAGCAGSRPAAWLRYASYRLAGPPPAQRCAADGTWCVYTPPPGIREESEEVLYFLHQALGDAASWGRLPVSRVFYARAKALGLAAPRVVAVSYGALWTLLETPGPEQPALLARLAEQDIPRIEGELGPPRRRFLWGMSQGGFNAASLLLGRPGLFARAVISCPALYDFPLYSDDEARRYVRRSGARPDYAWWGIARLRPRVGGPEAWERENPLAKAASARSLPPVLLQANRGDEYGFYEGAERLAALLAAQGLPVVWAPEPGGHCVLDARLASDFLLEGRARRASGLPPRLDTAPLD